MRVILTDNTRYKSCLLANDKKALMENPYVSFLFATLYGSTAFFRAYYVNVERLTLSIKHRTVDF